MAYLICANNFVHRIAANDTDKNSLNISDEAYQIINISDSDFNNIKLNNALIEVNGNTATIIALEEKNIFTDKNSLDKYISNIKIHIKNFLDFSVNNSKYDEINSYYNYLDSLDTSTITYPINSSWEEYCNNNSISFFHPLQIP